MLSFRQFALFSLMVWVVGCSFVLADEGTPAPAELPLLAGHELQTKINNAKGPLVLDFWAQWCAPCQAYSPVVHAVSKGYKGQMEFYRVDVSDPTNQDLVNGYSIQMIPTLMVFEKGDVVERWEGTFKKADLKKQLDKVLKNWLKTSPK